MTALQNIQRATQNYLGSSSGFSAPVTFSTPTDTDSPNYVTPQVVKTINALPVKHAYEISGVNNNGLFTRSQTVRVTAVENILAGAGFPVRDVNKKCILKDCLVSYTDINGNPVSGVITTIEPDDTVGLIRCQIRIS